MIRLVRAGIAAGVAASAVLAGVSGAAPRSPQPLFDQPVTLTTRDGFGGFEPSLVVDAHDNIWATAHRVDGVTPDDRAAAGVRSGSWLWRSSDGVKFDNPAGPAPVSGHEGAVISEGDLAVDDAGNVHFVDVAPPRLSYTSWRSTGRGEVSPIRTKPLLSQPGIDRPFISANGDTVLLAVNDLIGGPTAFTEADLLNEHQGTYSFYLSKNGGETFSLTGSHPIETDFCRPHVSRRDARILVAACTTFVVESVDDAAPKIGFMALVSQDGGATWEQKRLIAPFAPTRFNSFPSVAETPDGRIHMLFTRMTDQEEASTPTLATSTLLMTSSADGGNTWSPLTDVSPEPGLWQHASLAADRNGVLGIAGYHQPRPGTAWSFRAATWNPSPRGRVRDVVSAEVVPGLVAYSGADGDKPQGEFTQAAFDSQGRLNVIFAIREDSAAGPAGNGKRGSSSKVIFARQR